MKRQITITATALGALVLAAPGAQAGGPTPAALPAFSNPTDIDNPYAPFTRFRKCVLEGTDDGAEIKVIRRLQERTEPFTVDGKTVNVTIIKDIEFEDGELVEKTLDYFGQADDDTVHYFGEDVDNYEDGRVVDHEGSFRFGVNTQNLGVLMPGDPQVGDEWRAEDVPGVTLEENTLVGTKDKATINGHTYRDLVRVREFQDKEDVEFKLYAPGFGVVRENPSAGRIELKGCEK